jgi:hypothetical protein
MFVLDSLLVGGLRFVLDKVARVVDQELNDPAALHEQLLDAQMRLELGEITEEEWRATEREVLARLRDLQGQARGAEPGRVVGVDVRMEGDES